jgi:sodium/bile acid cotransporter 7
MKILKALQLIVILLFFPLIAISDSKETDKDRRSMITAKYKKLSVDFNCPVINSAQLKKAIKDGKAVLVDIRTPEEIKVSKIPGAVTEAEFKKNKNSYKNKKIVAYCTIGYRSGLFASKHQDVKVHNLLGGVLMWSHTGGKFVNNDGPTNKVHVFSKDWNFLNSNYKAITE